MTPGRPTRLEDCRLVLVYGGSFDPPHLAHITQPQRVRDALGADAIAYIPAGQAPHKRDRRQTPAHHRLAMLRLALRDQPHCVVLTDEIDRTEREPERPSYTVDTLEALHRRLGPNVKLRLLIGADMMRIFDQWYRPDRVAELAEPVVMVRPPDTRDSLLRESDAKIWGPRLVDVPPMEGSSTDVRDKLARGENVAGLIAPQVADYIREHGLYREQA